jgi:hypothetical protein
MDDQSADGYDTKVKRASNTSENGETGKDSGSSSRAGKHRKKRKIEVSGITSYDGEKLTRKGPLRQATLDQNFFKAVPAPNPPSSDSDISYVGRKLSAKARGKLPARN